MPHLKELHQRYKDQGLVLIGVHSDPDEAKMDASIKENALPYLIALDGDKSIMKAFHADSFPDYYLIDRSGKVRFADLANGDVDKAIAILLKEK